MDLRQKQIRSINKYTGEYFGRFNRDLRENPIPSSDESLIDYVNIWNFLDTNRVNNETMVYRGVNITSPEQKQEYERSLQIVNTYFISTSLSPQIARRFLNGSECCTMNIIIPAGSRAINITRYSQFAEENEVLLAPGFLRQTSLLNNSIYNCTYENYNDNYVINELYQRVILPINCESCELNFNVVNPAVIYCYNCYIHLCQDCSNFLHSLEGFSNHILYIKDDVRIGTTADPVLAFKHRKSTRKSRKSRKALNKKKSSKLKKDKTRKSTRSRRSRNLT